MKEPRHYHNQADFLAMQKLLMDGRKANNGTYYVHPGDLSWWLYYPPLDTHFWEHIYLWDDPVVPGSLLGWTLLSPDWVGMDVYTQPELRGSSLAMKMYLWAEQCAVKIAQEKGKPTIHITWASSSDEVLKKHLNLRGFKRNPGYVHLTRSLGDEILPVSRPDGFEIRSCRGEPEVTARATAQYGAFGSKSSFERYLDRFSSFMRSPVYHPDRDIVAASSDGQIAAFCIIWLDPTNLAGHFEPVGTHPGFQRKGLGRAVMKEGLRRLQSAGMTSADVATSDDNLSALKFYESIGFQVANHLGTYEKDV